MESTNSSLLERRSIPDLGGILDFMRLLWGVDHALQRMSKRMEGTLGVTGPQRLVVRIVGKFPGIPAGQLAQILRVHSSTLSGILKRLERQRLVRRRTDPRDARRSLLSLTDKGRRLDIDATGTIEIAIEHALSTARPEHLAATRSLLTSIESSLLAAIEIAPDPS